jgi:hypothetical protein
MLDKLSKTIAATTASATTRVLRTEDAIVASLWNSSVEYIRRFGDQFASYIR